MSEQKDLQEQLLLRAQECRKSVLVITTNGFQMRGVIDRNRSRRNQQSSLSPDPNLRT